MSVIHDQPAPVDPRSQPYSTWTGPGGPSGPGNTEEGPGGESRQPSHHRRVLAITASLSLAAAAAGGIIWAAGSTAQSTTAQSTTTLTTTQITAKTDPALVDVVSTLGYQDGTAAGTGLVLTSTGEVLTNNHVIEGATSIKVTDVGNGRTYRAVVVGYDSKDDIAVLQLQHASGLKTVTLGNSSTVKTGDKVVGIGNAGGRSGRPSAAAGTVTALGQTITASDEVSGTTEQLTGVIRTNANIQAGDSGGPLVNSHGQVIGIDTAASSGYQLQPGRTQTQSFAIAINKAVSIGRQIESGRSSATVHIGATAFIGVELSPGPQGGLPGSQASPGVTIAGVTSGSPAARAGLQTGDEIVSVGGHKVASSSGIQGALEGYHPGDKISISWLDQAGQTHTAALVLATGPAG
jgi:S1-C subfamily serine protease